MLFFAYGAVLWVSLWLSYALRWDFNLPTEVWQDLQILQLWLIPVKILSLSLWGQLYVLPAFLGWVDVSRISYAMISVAICLLLLNLGLGGISEWAPPRSVAVIDAVFSTGGLVWTRHLFVRIHRGRDAWLSQAEHPREKAAIVGANHLGAEVARSLINQHGQTEVLFFLDEDARKRGTLIHNRPVLGSLTELPELQQKYKLDTVIIALPEASVQQTRHIFRTALQCNCRVRRAPHTESLLTRNNLESLVRDIRIEDILGRDAVALDTAAIGDVIQGITVLITGAGGSIGSELTRQVLNYGPATLICLDHSEHALYNLTAKHRHPSPNTRLVPLLASIRDRGRMEQIFAQHRPDFLLHAAAYKHVPIMEEQPEEAVLNNTLGTIRLAEMAQAHCCSRFVLISTDKAINPTSAMGATKRLAEIYLQALAREKATTCFSAVRFGNVLGSSGSVVPLFQQQIADGGPVTVTHPDMQRYFMTIPEAVGLVLQCAAQAEGGEIFVLDMGEPVKIMDLAVQMIELCGLRAHKDIPIEITGLRPGEKLFEELNYASEVHAPTKHPHISAFQGTHPTALAPLRQQMVTLEKAALGSDRSAVITLLKAYIPEYQSEGGTTRPDASSSAVLPS